MSALPKCICIMLVKKVKGARPYCIINEQNQPVAKEYNRKLYYRQKLEKLFCVSENGYRTILLHVFQKVAEDF